MSCPWRKEWSLRGTTPPRGERRAYPAAGYLAQRDLRAAVARHGEDHRATHAARGRAMYYLGLVPQRGLVTPAAIAWLRESGAIEGYLNRAERRTR